MSRLIRLYPAAWRARYGAEMADLLEAMPPSAWDRLDLVRGALDAHLHPTWQAGRRPLVARLLSAEDERLVRRLGLATIVGGVIWAIVPALAMSGPIVADGSGTYRDGSAAIPIALLAGALLVAGLVGQLIRLPDEARLARVAAGTAIPFVLLFVAAPWLFPVGGVALALLVVAALSARRAGAWTTLPALAVVVSSLAMAGLTAFAILTFTGDRLGSAAIVYVGFTALIPVWLAIGRTLLTPRSSGRAAATSPEPLRVDG